MIEWTKETPTEEGYHWLIIKDADTEFEPRLFLAFDYCGELWADDRGMSLDNYVKSLQGVDGRIVLWCGPIKAPPVPGVGA